MSKKHQSIQSKAINAFVTAIINALFVWARQWNNDAFFFIIIGDKNCTDVAWHNTNGLTCDGAIAVSISPKTVAAFDDLKTGVDILVEDAIKDDKQFGETLERLRVDDYAEGWHSVENVNKDEKGGLQ